MLAMAQKALAQNRAGTRGAAELPFCAAPPVAAPDRPARPPGQAPAPPAAAAAGYTPPGPARTAAPRRALP